MGISRTRAIIETMPFSKELISWCINNPDLAKALKIVYPKKFLTLGAIVTSHCKYKPEDEVIGIYTYAYKMQKPIFKQDFVINTGSLNKQFVLYTKYPSKSKYVRDISDFYKTYGKDGDYLNTHHMTFEELPEKVKFAGTRSIILAEKIKNNGLLKNDPNRNAQIYKDVLKLKKDPNTVTKQKLY